MKSFKRYLIENIDVSPGDTEFKSVYAGKRHHEAENDGRWLGTPYEVPDSEDTAEEQQRKISDKARSTADDKNAIPQVIGSAVAPVAAGVDLNRALSAQGRDRWTPRPRKSVKTVIQNIMRNIPAPFGPMVFGTMGAIEAAGHLTNVTPNVKTGDPEWDPQLGKATKSVATSMLYYQIAKHVIPKIGLGLLATAAVPGYVLGLGLAKAADYVLDYPDNDGHYDRMHRSDTYDPKTWYQGGQETGKSILRKLRVLPSIKDEIESKLPKIRAQVKKDKTERANSTKFNTTPRSHSSAGAPVAAGTVKNSNGQIMYQ